MRTLPWKDVPRSAVGRQGCKKPWVAAGKSPRGGDPTRVPGRVAGKSPRRFRPSRTSFPPGYVTPQRVELDIARAPFRRLVRDVLQTRSIEPNAMDALHEAAEEYLVRLFINSWRNTEHRGRRQLEIQDMLLALVQERNPL